MRSISRKVVILAQILQFAMLAQSKEGKRIDLCEFFERPKDFSGQLVTVVGVIEQNQYHRVLKVPEGLCGPQVDKKPAKERELLAEFPRGAALESASQQTRQIIGVFDEMARYRARELAITVTVLGIPRVAPGDKQRPLRMEIRGIVEPGPTPKQ